MNTNDQDPSRAIPCDPEDAGNANFSGPFDSVSDRSKILSKKLKSRQINLPATSRPLNQIQRFPEIGRHIREHAIPGIRKNIKSPKRLSALQSLELHLAGPITPCLSFHFPLPKCARKILEAIDDWEDIQKNLNQWAVDVLDAIATEFIDVENLSEGCRECIPFTSRCFPDQYADEGDLYDEVISLGWRVIGNQVAITIVFFEAEENSVNTGQYGVPQQELSDLFNRSLPPELTMVYFEAGESNGFYVLIKTANLHRLESLYSFEE
jgi:hypothetical protein